MEKVFFFIVKNGVHNPERQYVMDINPILYDSEFKKTPEADKKEKVCWNDMFYFVVDYAVRLAQGFIYPGFQVYPYLEFHSEDLIFGRVHGVYYQYQTHEFLISEDHKKVIRFIFRVDQYGSEEIFIDVVYVDSSSEEASAFIGGVSFVRFGNIYDGYVADEHDLSLLPARNAAGGNDGADGGAGSQLSCYFGQYNTNDPENRSSSDSNTTPSSVFGGNAYDCSHR